MSASESNPFQFYPRPEAKALQWDHLVPPVQRAVRDLLMFLAGAVRQSHDPDLEVASSFLVNGERGTGKTSVLLNAKKAVESEKGFFSTPQASIKQNEAIDCAKIIREHAVWLDILDLEPLQPETNLLTTVLTRIRDALCPANCQDRDREITSLFEASTDSARPLLDQLISDATFMWENFREQDTRSVVHRQVSAAGIYAQFRDRFRKALDQLAGELGRPHGRDQRRSIILPIDNIDRSTEHLHNIAKLAQLVSHPRLWLVMAGGREDIDTFLERAYWKELIRNSEARGTQALGRNESNGEGEALSMARRQAAATGQKIWPSSHRISVGPMKPEETLRFCPPDKLPAQSIEDLLREVNIQTWLKNSDDKPVSIPLFSLFEHVGMPFGIVDIKDINTLIKSLKNAKKDSIHSHILSKDENLKQRIDALTDTVSEKDKIEIITLVLSAINKCLKEKDLIYSKERFEGVRLRLWVVKKLKHYRKEMDKNTGFYPPDYLSLNKAIIEDCLGDGLSRPLTPRGSKGLKMPARCVLELWQLAHWVVNDKTSFVGNEHYKAEQIARTMLRNAIAESKLPNRLSRRLQEGVIRIDINEGTLLNFKKTRLKVECAAPNDTEIRLPGIVNPYVKSRIRVKRGTESFLRLSLKDEWGGSGEKNSEEELPEFVAAWLAILYDILGLSERLAVLSAALIPPPKMATCHLVTMQIEGPGWRTIEEELKWPVPTWVTFRAHGLLWRHWTNFQRQLDMEWENQQTDPLGILPKYLAVGWIRCVLDTYVDMHRFCEVCGEDSKKIQQEIKNNKLHEKIIANLHSLKWPKNEAGVKSLECIVLAHAAVIHDCLAECVKKPVRLRRRFDSQEMLDWLEKDLPMMFSHWYVPTKHENQLNFEEIFQGMKTDEELNKSLKNAELTGEEIGDFYAWVNNLTQFWEKNKFFIVATMDGRIAELFKPHEGASDKDKEIRAIEHREYLARLSKLCGLHKALWLSCEDQSAPTPANDTTDAATSQ